MTTDKQNRTKMGMLADQLRKHCKEKNLHCFIFTEGDKEGTNIVSGYFGDALAASAVQHLFMLKPDLVRAAIKQVEEFAAVEEWDNLVPKKLIIEP